METNIDLVFVDAGGGHRAAATALEAVMRQRHPGCKIRLLDLQDVLDELDIFRKYAHIRLEDIYNRMLEHGWTAGSHQLLRVMQGFIRVYHPPQVRVLTKYWRERRPALVVSLVPNFNRAMCAALQVVDPAIPFVTVLTDLADYPPRFWIERQRQTFICGTPFAAVQARHNSPESVVHEVSGMILNPRFYDMAKIDVGAERVRLGLDQRRPTGVVLFGGVGSDKMWDILRRVDRSSLDVQLILLCGKNEPLRRRLSAHASRIAKVVEGFTRDVPRFMQMADFLIGKPGPGSISEAIHMGLPVIVEKNAWTLPQERFNADWVVDQQVGESLASFADIVPAIGRLLAGDRLARLQGNARALRNRAVFEVADLLATLVSSSRGPVVAALPAASPKALRSASGLIPG